MKKYYTYGTIKDYQKRKPIVNFKIKNKKYTKRLKTTKDYYRLYAIDSQIKIICYIYKFCYRDIIIVKPDKKQDDEFLYTRLY